MKVGDLVRHKPCGYVGVVIRPSRHGREQGLSCWTVLRITGVVQYYCLVARLVRL
jgi:hypothetical protein